MGRSSANPNGLVVPALFAFVTIVSTCGATAAQEPDPPMPMRIGPAVLTGYVQFDYRTVVDDDPGGFYPRRVRALLSGPVTQGIKWAISAEATGTPALRDAYIILEYFPAATVRIGQLVMPYGHERSVQTSNTMPFTERVLAELAPGRDAGITIGSERPLFGWLSYAAAVHNGTPQNTRDNNRAKDSLVRLVASPVRLRGIAVGVNATRGDQPEGMRTRFGTDVTLSRRSQWLGAEFLSERTRDGEDRRDGWYLFAGWMLYPEAPRRGLHHVELATRYARLQGTISTAQWDFSANYYVHRGLRFMFDVVVPQGGNEEQAGAGLHARANLRF